MGSAHHSLREHPIMFAFGEVVQIPLKKSTKRKKKRHPVGCLLFLVAEVGFEPRRGPLAVPKILCSLFASQNFDRYANKRSLHRPQDAVACVAPGTRSPCCSITS